MFFFLVFIFDYVKAVFFTILTNYSQVTTDILAAESLAEIPILDQSLYITIYFPCSRCTRWCSSLDYYFSSFFSFSHLQVCAAVFLLCSGFYWVRVLILANRSDGWDKCPLSPWSKCKALRLGVHLILLYFTRILFWVRRLFFYFVGVGVGVDVGVGGGLFCL